ncbi:protein PHOTOSYSTEM I ASSEMBLY 2, chloroplastic-like isoform X2 [Panicum virgatum]|uniref:protein PHOTOSYSTEM I ASSEMBLY 2, chloroplastic-like isoform X2 n=1 Tax=Panicum virgatum TaxID=38727 RepID=UPI0019D5869D|nr:protein PHOTOSYSTEM I ASSEMBLY 2, chloroplastic-like isoform X2 [Panicum virgatum]
MELAIAAASGSLVVTGLRCRTTGSAAAADVAWRVTSTARLCRRAMASGRAARLMVSAAGCKTCKGKGAVECPGCKGTGKNKKNGNIFERWKCFDCQGFGLKSCPSCGKGGLTPEQRGER